MKILLNTSDPETKALWECAVAATAEVANMPTWKTGLPEFQKYPKIPRLEKMHVILTEKIDGTNAQIVVPENPEEPLKVGSRNRWIFAGSKDNQTDNYGFAAWVGENEAALRNLGPGVHYGEWWGRGIGRNYGLQDRRLSLFNALRPLPEGLPANVSVVPVLAHFNLNTGDWFDDVTGAISGLLKRGSVAAPGFMRPEGVILRIDSLVYKLVFDKTGPSPEQTDAN